MLKTFVDLTLAVVVAILVAVAGAVWFNRPLSSIELAALVLGIVLAGASWLAVVVRRRQLRQQIRDTQDSALW